METKVPENFERLMKFVVFVLRFLKLQVVED